MFCILLPQLSDQVPGNHMDKGIGHKLQVAVFHGGWLENEG